MALTASRGGEGEEGEGKGEAESVRSENKQAGCQQGLEGKGYATVEAETGVGTEAGTEAGAGTKAERQGVR